MVAGDYYNQNGDWIGNDLLEDGTNYLVTNQNEAQQIQQGTQRGQNVSTPSDYTSLLELPKLAIRQEVGAAVTRSNNPTGGTGATDDTTGGFHEEGGLGIVTANGQRPAPALPGAVQDPLETNPLRFIDPLGHLAVDPNYGLCGPGCQEPTNSTARKPL